jgi:hypothetical protein
MAHEPTSATGVVEMHVRQENVVNVCRIDVLVAQTRQQIIDTIVDTGVDECGAAVLQDQVAGIEQGGSKARIDRGYAVTVVGRVTTVLQRGYSGRPGPHTGAQAS